MKIAIASDGKTVTEHFGYCEGFQIYEIESDKVLKSDFIKNPGHRPGFLPVFLKDNKVDVVISGGMGGSAQKLFDENGIKVIVGVKGNCDDIAKEYKEGKLKSTDDFCD